MRISCNKLEAQVPVRAVPCRQQAELKGTWRYIVLQVGTNSLKVWCNKWEPTAHQCYKGFSFFQDYFSTNTSIALRARLTGRHTESPGQAGGEEICWDGNIGYLPPWQVVAMNLEGKWKANEAEELHFTYSDCYGCYSWWLVKHAITYIPSEFHQLPSKVLWTIVS